jgi:hypothetical protein
MAERVGEVAITQCTLNKRTGQANKAEKSNKAYAELNRKLGESDKLDT